MAGEAFHSGPFGVATSLVKILGRARPAIRATVWVGVVLALAACGGGGGDAASNPPPVTNPPPPTTPPPTTPPPTTPPPAGTSCVATAQPDLGTAVALDPVFESLTFNKPVLMLQAPGDSSNWYVVEQDGFVRSFANSDSAASVSTFANIDSRVNSSAGGEAGLLGMAFDPNYATNQRVYLSYTANPTTGGVLESRISRFTVSGGAIVPGSESILLTIEQPFANHNGGNIVFGPDGMLYAGFGDGGSGGDPDNNAQNRSKLLGKMIRIDVSGDGAYVVPTDNPFVAGGARCQAGVSGSSAVCAEIYAYGFRNPWRWSFDRAASTADLWLADVGQGAWEEVDRVERGGNYGWRLREGQHCFQPTTNCAAPVNGAPLIEPVAEYGHDLGASVTGGYVYRGSAIASLVGRYVFGDFGSGRLFVLIPDATGKLERQQLLQSSVSISSFGQGSDGELYLVDYSGKIFKLVPGSSTPTNPIRTLLSQTGCVDATDPKQPAAALIPYTPSAPFWSDGATKTRWLAVPDGQKIAVNATTGDFDFPNGTVLVKNFALNGQLIETRLFMRHSDTGNWGGYTYRWNDAQTDATLVTGGLIAKVGGQDWIYPSEAQCLQCHTQAAGRSLGLEIRQLSSTQLDALEAKGLFTTPPARATVMPDPADGTQPLVDRARAYLHTNCAQCHRPNGGTPVALDLQYTTAIAATNTCNAAPASGDLGVANAKVIAPADATHSVLYLRMSRRDSNKMPPVGSHLVDTAGAALLQQWINGMNASCQ